MFLGKSAFYVYDVVGKHIPKVSFYVFEPHLAEQVHVFPYLVVVALLFFSEPFTVKVADMQNGILFQVLGKIQHRNPHFLHPNVAGYQEIRYKKRKDEQCERHQYDFETLTAAVMAADDIR